MTFSSTILSSFLFQSLIDEVPDRIAVHHDQCIRFRVPKNEFQFRGLVAGVDRHPGGTDLDRIIAGINPFREIGHHNGDLIAFLHAGFQQSHAAGVGYRTVWQIGCGEGEGPAGGLRVFFLEAILFNNRML